jgi:hypothetical protein
MFRRQVFEQVPLPPEKYGATVAQKYFVNEKFPTGYIKRREATIFGRASWSMILAPVEPCNHFPDSARVCRVHNTTHPVHDPLDFGRENYVFDL